MQMESTQYQDQLVRGLAHRMNNILTLFHGYVGLLLENESLDKSTRDGLAKIKDGADAATELMDRTHALVRPSALVWRELNLAEFVPMLKVVFDGIAKARTTIEIVCPDELPTVWVDAGRIKTAIVELVRNACEATGNAGGTVRIEVGVEPPDLSTVGTSGAGQPIKWITISVIDHGPGISPDAEERIFQPFYSTKKRQNAAGLGLNVAAGLVQQLGGVIRHSSEPGFTCFKILLPARSEMR